MKKQVYYLQQSKTKGLDYINSSEKSKIIAAGGSSFNGINKNFLWKNHNVKMKKISWVRSETVIDINNTLVGQEKQIVS